MQHETRDTISLFPASAWPPSMHDPAVLAHPDFLAGFQAGVDAYEEACDEHHRKRTGRDVLKDVADEVDPSPAIRRGMSVAAAMFGPVEPLYTVGFLAGELYAHLLTPEPPASMRRDTETLPVVSSQGAKIIPIRM